jgi:membrane-bound lytic murein transglycosylase A
VILPRIVGAAFVALALSACVPNTVTDRPEPPHLPARSSAPVLPRGVVPSPGNKNPVTPPFTAISMEGAARMAGVRGGPAIASLAISPDNARSALAAFRLSCPALLRRVDTSGLTRGADWAEACAVAVDWPDSDARGFFDRSFDTAIVGDGAAFATGYYEPEILAAPVRGPGFTVPIYRRPADLVEADLGQFSDTWKGKRIRGRVTDGKLVPYPDRAAIEAGALAGRGLEIAWAADNVEFFFLQVQGSGRLRMPDGTILRIGYDGQNGRDYTGIGALMRNRGLLGPAQTSMQGIMAWLRSHPDEAPEILNTNKSFVFFREVWGAGPPGALGVAVGGRTTVAADPAFVPLGAPVFLTLDRPEATGLWVAQDTGGAIKGANRFDTFWGAGDEARRIAGGMSGRGQALLFLPKGSVARLMTGSGGGADGGAATRR